MNEEAEVKETETTLVTSATQNGEAYEPVAEDTQELDVEASQEQSETDETPSSETDEQEDENHSEKEKSGSEYVKEAYECFLKDRPNDTEPLSVIRDFFDTNASDELKKKCAEEGKTVEGAYEFMCAVAQKGSGKSISDSVGLSICMHYFQDVPAMEDFEPVLKKAAQKRREEERQAKEAERKSREKDNPPRKEKRGKAKKSSTERNREIEDRIEKDIAKRESKVQKKGASGAIKDQTHGDRVRA